MLAADNGFSGGVTPSRFELNAEQGEVLRRSIKIYNLSARPQQFNVKTVDWQYSAAGSLSFQDTLAEDSCRPWVKLERHQISVVADPQRPRNFRFEIEVPEGAKQQECRFAVMIENIDASVAASFADGAVSMPISGRIAVIVYIGVGDVLADIQLGEMSMQPVNAGELPAIEVRNQGQAHGRLDADLIAEDEQGKKARLSLATTPILPGQTRFLALTPEPGKELRYPLTVKGKIYSDNDTYEVEQKLYAGDSRYVAKD